MCGARLLPGTSAVWDRAAKKATCVSNSDEATAALVGEAERGRAGASVAREWERRHGLREARVRMRHNGLGGPLLALSSDPQSTSSWATGARGEQTSGRSLDRLREEGIAVLHDRRIPGSRANIDHVVVSRAGVFVIDTKQYKGRVQKRDVGGWFETDLRLYVNGRDRSRLITKMKPQVEAVRRALATDNGSRAVPVIPVLLFISPENWSLFNFRPLRFGDVFVLCGKALGKLIRADANYGSADVQELERALATALPSA